MVRCHEERSLIAGCVVHHESGACPIALDGVDADRSDLVAPRVTFGAGHVNVAGFRTAPRCAAAQAAIPLVDGGQVKSGLKCWSICRVKRGFENYFVAADDSGPVATSCILVCRRQWSEDVATIETVHVHSRRTGKVKVLKPEVEVGCAFREHSDPPHDIAVWEPFPGAVLSGINGYGVGVGEEKGEALLASAGIAGSDRRIVGAGEFDELNGVKREVPGREPIGQRCRGDATAGHGSDDQAGRCCGRSEWCHPRSLLEYPPHTPRAQSYCGLPGF